MYLYIILTFLLPSSSALSSVLDDVMLQLLVNATLAPLVTDRALLGVGFSKLNSLINGGTVLGERVGLMGTLLDELVGLTGTCCWS